jgi:hypothetical protein
VTGGVAVVFDGGPIPAEAGVFATIGGWLGGNRSSLTYPAADEAGNAAVGALANVGFVLGLTNATQLDDLRGLSKSAQVGFGVGPVKITLDLGFGFAPDGDLVFTFTFGPPQVGEAAGLGFCFLRTETRVNGR